MDAGGRAKQEPEPRKSEATRNPSQTNCLKQFFDLDTGSCSCIRMPGMTGCDHFRTLGNDKKEVYRHTLRRN